MRLITATLPVLVCFASLLACSREETPPGSKTAPPAATTPAPRAANPAYNAANPAPNPAHPASKAARVSATKAFESYFGPAPTTDKGICYAFVIFFPSAKQAGKVVPFPFFSFDEPSLKKVALQRLVVGMDEAGYAGQFLQLFPKGTALISVSEQKGTLTVNFSKELQQVAADPGRSRSLFNAVGMTAAQFEGVTAVRIQSDGSDLFAGNRRTPGTRQVLQPSPPRLLKVVGMKESPKAQVTEVDALFDRPVDIKEFQFASADGSLLSGDIFQSMFDMAAVLKPKEPARLAGATSIKVRWQVTDKKGRSASGEGLLPFQVTVHQD